MFGNSLYDSLWMQNGCPENIIISDQQMDCRGPLRQKRFGNPGSKGHDGKPWDGTHMRGYLAVKHYSNSMIRIMNECNPLRQDNYHETCPQTVYQRKHSPRTQYHNQSDNNYQYQTRRGRGRTYQNTSQYQQQQGQGDSAYSEHGQYYEDNTVGVSNRFSVLGN